MCNTQECWFVERRQTLSHLLCSGHNIRLSTSSTTVGPPVELLTFTLLVWHCRPSCYNTTLSDHNCSGRHEGDREGQDLNNRKCCHNIDLETRVHTFMLSVRKPVMCFGIRETLATLVVWRVQKNTFLRRSRFVSCVHTQVRMTSCLFVHICLHVTCTNKNMDTHELRPSLYTQVHVVCAHSWIKMVSRMTQRRFHMSSRHTKVCLHETVVFVR